MNVKCETCSLWVRTTKKRRGEINRSPPSLGSSSPGAALQVVHPSFLLKREHQAKCILTRTVDILLRTTSTSLPVMSNHTVVCPRWQEKNTSYFRSGLLFSKQQQHTLNGLSATCFSTIWHLGNQFSWFLRDAQWKKFSEEINLLMYAE